MHSTTQGNTPQHKHGTNTDKSAFSFVCLVSAKPKIPDKRRRNVRWNNLAFAEGDAKIWMAGNGCYIYVDLRFTDIDSSQHFSGLRIGGSFAIFKYLHHVHYILWLCG